MPGSLATFATCSYTFASMSRISLSLAKITPGTRMPPDGLISHSNSDRRSSSARSTRPPLHVHDALGEPAAGLRHHPQRGIGRTFHFDGRAMTRHLQRLAPNLRRQAIPLQLHFEAAEQHVARRHLVN